MKATRIILAVILTLVAFLLVGFMVIVMNNGGNTMDFNANLDLVNRQEIPLDSVADFEIAYRSDSVEILRGTGDTIVLEEYMNQQNPAYLANIDVNGDKLLIQSGERPSFNIGLFGLRTKILVYLPDSYSGNLTASCSSGSIRREDPLNVKNLDVSVNSGSIRFGDIQAAGAASFRASSGSIHLENLSAGDNAEITATSGGIRVESIHAQDVLLKANSGSVHADAIQADTIQAETTSGSVTLNDAYGKMECKANSGSVKVTGGGSGTFSTTSGGVRVALSQVTGDINANCNSGSVNLTIPKSLSFNFKASVSSGFIKTDFNDLLAFDEKGKHASGQIGVSPIGTIDLSATSGGIRVEYQD